MFKRRYKCLFEDFMKTQKVAFGREAKKMSKEVFNDHLINFMDLLFGEGLNL